MSTSSKWPQPVRAFEYPAVLRPGSTERRAEEEAALRTRDEVVRETELRVREEFSSAIAQEREQVKRAVVDFAEERETYYRRVEAEVVQLASAIARRILHREADVDPLMLAGVVRVALDNLRAATDIKLHVCPAHAEEWHKLFEDPSMASHQVTIMEEPLFAPAQCRLESSLGTVELGVDDQLKEIEQGFFDLLAARPR